jgi:hypothetical protein
MGISFFNTVFIFFGFLALILLVGAGEKGHPRRWSRRVPTQVVAEERRKHPRVRVSWPATILTDQGALHGKVLNISLDNALIHLEELPSLNMPLALAIEIPDYDYALVATAEIIRIDIYEGDHPATSYGLGVHFIEISEEDKQFIASELLHLKK